ncbi:hypothetical protein GCM10022232_92970 [Streptomyces plumbiresistens]|uniref:Uncharacterized protein n=1 Tax=Streptomyces plumbiresistens TaxID=511811 RepID=A0ABP7TWV8_9ACTN
MSRTDTATPARSPPRPHLYERALAAIPPSSIPPADLANAHARNTQHLERRPAEPMGEQVWPKSGFGALTGQEELQRQVSRLEHANTELLARLEERDAEPEADRAANGEPIRALNQNGAAQGALRRAPPASTAVPRRPTRPQSILCHPSGSKYLASHVNTWPATRLLLP